MGYRNFQTKLLELNMNRNDWSPKIHWLVTSEFRIYCMNISTSPAPDIWSRCHPIPWQWTSRYAIKIYSKNSPWKSLRTSKYQNQTENIFRHIPFITGWWFGRWILFVHMLAIIIPFDEYFSEGWLNHLPKHPSQARAKMLVAGLEILRPSRRKRLRSRINA